MTRREAGGGRREGHGERRQPYEDEVPGAVLSPPASRLSPEQWPTVERRAPTLLACAGVEMPRLFPDDVLTFCAQCGAAIHHRPWALAELGPHARAACLPCAARHEQACAQRRCGAEAQAPLDATAPRRLAPATAGITRRTLVEGARYLGEHRR